MPYIKDKNLRKILNGVSDDLIRILENHGIIKNMNYFIYRTAKYLCKNYVNFATYEGDIQQSLKEIYRRLESKYEDEKIKENGDI